MLYLLLLSTAQVLRVESNNNFNNKNNNDPRQINSISNNDGPSNYQHVNARRSLGDDIGCTFSFPPPGEFLSLVGNAYLITGQANLNALIKDDITGSNIALAFQNTPSKEVEVRTFDGAWVGDVYLPDASQIEDYSKFQMNVRSSWAVWFHYNGGGSNGGTSVRMFRHDLFNLVALGGTWLLEETFNEQLEMGIIQLPTCSPSLNPSKVVTNIPSVEPSIALSTEPSSKPSTKPSAKPSKFPTQQPSSTPSYKPSIEPSTAPTLEGSSMPSLLPSLEPSTFPSLQPSNQPSPLFSEATNVKVYYYDLSLRPDGITFPSKETSDVFAPYKSEYISMIDEQIGTESHEFFLGSDKSENVGAVFEAFIDFSEDGFELCPEVDDTVEVYVDDTYAGTVSHERKCLGIGDTTPGTVRRIELRYILESRSSAGSEGLRLFWKSPRADEEVIIPSSVFLPAPVRSSLSSSLFHHDILSMVIFIY